MDKPSEKWDPQTFAIIGAAMEVHAFLGHGFLEAVYQDALSHEFQLRQIPFAREHPVPIRYKGQLLSSPYRADFVCFSNIIVELKALSSFTKVEESQLLHYLKAARMHRGLLVNFGSKSLQHKRLVWGPETRGEFEGGFDNIAPETE